MPIRLGELLLKENMVSPQQLKDVLDHQKQNGGTLSRAIVSLGILKEESITKMLSRQFGVPWISLEAYTVDASILKVVPEATARKYRVLPLSRSDKTLTIAMADPTNVLAIDDIRFMTGYRVEVVVAGESALEDAIERHYGSTRSQRPRQDGGGGVHGSPAPAGEGGQDASGGSTLTLDDIAAIGGLSELDLDSLAEADAQSETARPDDDEIDLGNLAKSANAPPVVKLTDLILVDSLKRGASDIHVEPYEKEFRVRFRIDGVLYNVMAMPMKLRDPLTSRIKVMAKLSVAEKRLPQDGIIKIRMRVEDRSRDFVFRVSVRPTLWGETIALRLRDKSRVILDLSKAGLEPRSLEQFLGAISRRSGIVLVSGPQRAGKSNTLYAAIAALNKPHSSVMTAEDPVELVIPGVNQVQVEKATGESLATVLRSFGHADADAIGLSEIADYETASMAVRLAQQGHLVVSTFPASDAASTVLGLLNLGIDPYTLATTVNLVQAQRLVRRICSKCKFDDTAGVPSKVLLAMGFERHQVGTFRVMKGKGCTACNDTGYKGQVGLFETMEITEWIRDLIMAGAGAAELRDKAIEEGMLTLRRSGLEKIKNGVTTVEEVLRETVEDPRGTMREVRESATAGSRAASRATQPAPEGEPALHAGEGGTSDDPSRLLAAQLAAAQVEIETLRQRLFEADRSSAVAVQLANAKAEIETLQQRLFELTSYRLAYERLLGERASPTKSDH